MKRTLKIAFPLLLLLLLFTLNVGHSQPSLEFRSIPDNFDIDDPKAVVAININYDDIEPERQLFHLFLPDTTGSYPLVVYIHGGGFTGGNPGTVFNNEDRRAEVKYFLSNGFAYASIGYRVINDVGPDEEGVIKSLGDSKRALQFIRYYAEEFHIDPEKIASIGTSAGSGTGLWLGTRSDMADPNAEDPVLRESTRLCAVLAYGSQSTYDLYKWESQVYNDFDGQGTNYTLDSIANLLSFQRVSNFYGGLDSLYQITEEPRLIQYRQDVDMLYHMSDDDPPVYVYSRSPAVRPSDDLFHHSFHGREIYLGAIAAGLPDVKAYIPAQSINTTDGESGNEFLIRHVNACALSTSVSEELDGQLDQFNLYPNPAQGQVSIEWEGHQIRKVEVYTLAGQLLFNLGDTDSESLILETSALGRGIFIVKVADRKGKQLTKKLILN